jgi:hypothetical protein
MSLLDIASRRLSSVGYSVAPWGDEVRFEDASVLGFVAQFPTVEQLTSGWEAAQERFLLDNARALRRDRRKSWNVYSILLTSEVASAEQTRVLTGREEDFQSTRKIARSGIVTDRDVDSAIAVLLPIRHRVSLSSEDALELVADRLATLPERAVKSLLAGGSGEDFADALLREEEPE